MKRTVKKALSLLLTLAMLLSLLTLYAGAAGTEKTAETETISGETVITAGGTYQLTEGATGKISIQTTQPVTLVGNGAEWDQHEKSESFGKVNSTANQWLYIDCSSVSGVTLTLRDVYIDNSQYSGASDNTINFAGNGNTLIFDGTVIIDHDGNAKGYACIHAGSGTSLTVRGTTGSKAYLYKREQAAGIGGNSGEACGTIYFGVPSGENDFYIFLKASKQGAAIGNGANCSSVPGNITFYSGVYNLVEVAQGALIGGSSGAASKDAGNVYIRGGLLNLNVDYSGAAIGGGGYKTGDGGSANDKGGGTVHMIGGSVRTYIDTNAANNASWGVTEACVNDAAITANKVNASGEAVYMLPVNTGTISAAGGVYTVKVDDALYYSGPGYSWCYCYENIDRDVDNNVYPEGTPGNWIALTKEPNLYVYATGKNHCVEVNGELFMAVWDAESKTFTMEPHSHSYSLAYDKDGHWEKCECGDTANSAKHTFGAWVVDREATAAQLGEKHRECSVCGYTETKMYSMSDYTLSVSDTVDGTAEVQSGDNVTMYVTVSSDSGADFHGMQATVIYDPELFRLDSVSGPAADDAKPRSGAVELYALNDEGYESGAVVANLTFTAIAEEQTDRIGSFSFAPGATAGDYEDFRADDALAAAVSGDSVKILAVNKTYPVTLGDGLSGSDTATHGQAYTGIIDDYDPIVYDYTVTYTVGGVSDTITEFGRDGSFTIPGDQVTGAISVTVSKTIRYYSVTLPRDPEERYTVSALDKTTGIKGREPFSFTVKVKDGYQIDSVQANGVEVAPDEDGVYTITILANTEITVTVSKKTLGGDPEAEVWDGETIDIRWFTDNPRASKFYITYPAEFAGLAALVNGIYNEEIRYIYGDESYIVDLSSTGTSGGNNESTDTYHYGAYDFSGKTIYLCADIDMGRSNNYMPIGGQYLMTDEDTSTKIGSSFCGTLDGQGHNVTIYCDRHCSGNYGDGQSVGLIGRLGCHDNDPSNMWPSNAGVRNLAVYGSVRGNRSVGGIVGKIGKTNGGATIECCANYASVTGTDAKGTGGIVGAAWNGGVIENCYNSGTVTSTFTNAVAGIAGSCEIDVINCYNAGSVVDPRTTTAAIASNNGGSTYQNCYWLSGSADTGVYGSSTKEVMEKTSDYMRTAEFVSVLGSAFAMDTADINNGYPILAWQKTSSAGAIIKSTTTVKNGVAETTVEEKDVSASVAAAKTGRFDTLYIITDAGSKSVDQTDVVIPRASMEEIADASLSLCIETADGTRATMSAKVLSDIADRAAKQSVVITVTPRTRSEVEKLLETVSGYEDTYLEGSAAVAVSISSGGVELRGFTGRLDIEFPVSSEDFRKGETYDLLQIKSDGSVSKLSGTCIASGNQLYIRFNASGVGTFIALNQAKTISYDDVKPGDWFYDAVMYVTRKGIMDGIGNDLFDPYGDMTRSMLVTVLYRLEGEPAVTGTSAFADVKSGQWYTDAVIWATKNSIVKGYGNGLFGTEDKVTREQIATILYRYAAYKGYSTAGAANLVQYTDASEIGSWALTAMKWANAEGLITGRTTTTLAPQGTAMRAEVAAILMRLCENIVK